MRKLHRLLGTGLLVSTLAGCQTWVPEAGLTLPSPHYLRHPPQFFQRSPDFPLPKELDGIEKVTAEQAAASGRPIGP